MSERAAGAEDYARVILIFFDDNLGKLDTQSTRREAIKSIEQLGLQIRGHDGKLRDHNSASLQKAVYNIFQRHGKANYRLDDFYRLGSSILEPKYLTKLQYSSRMSTGISEPAFVSDAVDQSPQSTPEASEDEPIAQPSDHSDFKPLDTRRTLSNRPSGVSSFSGSNLQDVVVVVQSQSSTARLAQQSKSDNVCNGYYENPRCQKQNAKYMNKDPNGTGLICGSCYHIARVLKLGKKRPVGLATATVLPTNPQARPSSSRQDDTHHGINSTVISDSLSSTESGSSTPSRSDISTITMNSLPDNSPQDDSPADNAPPETIRITRRTGPVSSPERQIRVARDVAIIAAPVRSQTGHDMSSPWTLSPFGLNESVHHRVQMSDESIGSENEPVHHRVQMSDESIGKENEAIHDAVKLAVLDLLRDTRVTTSNRSQFVSNPERKLRRLYDRVLSSGMRTAVGGRMPISLKAGAFDMVEQDMSVFSAYNIMRSLVGAAILHELYEERWDWKTQFDGHHPRECFEAVAKDMGFDFEEFLTNAHWAQANSETFRNTLVAQRASARAYDICETLRPHLSQNQDFVAIGNNSVSQNWLAAMSGIFKMALTLKCKLEGTGYGYCFLWAEIGTPLSRETMEEMFGDTGDKVLFSMFPGIHVDPPARFRDMVSPVSASRNKVMLQSNRS